MPTCETRRRHFSDGHERVVNEVQIRPAGFEHVKHNMELAGAKFP